MENLSNLVNESANMQNRKRIFECESCNASFKTKQKWRRHKISCQGGRETFECDICLFTFIEKSSLDQHICTVPDGKIFTCGTCNVSFLKRYNLKIHINTVHEEEDSPDNR